MSQPELLQYLFESHRFNDSLKSNVSQLNQSNPLIYYVFGNESADLDSIVSAISYSFLRESMLRQMIHYFNAESGKLNNLSQDRSLFITNYSFPTPSFIPVISINRKDLLLRGEVIYTFSTYLKELNLSCDLKPTLDDFINNYLVFLDDLPQDLLDNNENLNADPWFRLILCDHNRLSIKFSNYQNLVVSIIDHHLDDKLNMDLPEDKIELRNRSTFDSTKGEDYSSFNNYIANKEFVGPRIISPAGSCASLVAQQYMMYADKLCESSHDSWGYEWWYLRIPAERKSFLKYILLPPILIDTACLNPEAGRATELDNKAVDHWITPHLFGIILNSYPKELIASSDDDNREQEAKTHFLNKIFNNTMEAKQDVAHLSDLDLFRKDYKEYIIGDSEPFIYGISSIQWSFRDYTVDKYDRKLPGWISLRESDIDIKDIENCEPPSYNISSSKYIPAWKNILKNSLLFSYSSTIPTILYTFSNNINSESSKVPTLSIPIASTLDELNTDLNSKLNGKDVKSLPLNLHIVMTAFEHASEPMESDSEDSDYEGKNENLGPYGFQRELLVVIPPWSKVHSLVDEAVKKGLVTMNSNTHKKAKNNAGDSAGRVSESNIFKLIEGKHRVRAEAEDEETLSKTDPQLKLLTRFDCKANQTSVALGRLYVQRNLQMSRKQIQPYIESIIRKLLAIAN